MNNMRRGFTMIELIFVIVIIGILAAVAIPKLAGTAEEAKESIYESFMGTLNRTVGPAMWADMVADQDGSVKTLITEELVKTYTELPAGYEDINLNACSAPGVAPGQVATLTAAETGLEDVLNIFCNDGTPTKAPTFGFSIDGNETNATFTYNGS